MLIIALIGKRYLFFGARFGKIGFMDFGLRIKRGHRWIDPDSNQWRIFALVSANPDAIQAWARHAFPAVGDELKRNPLL